MKALQAGAMCTSGYVPGRGDSHTKSSFWPPAWSLRQSSENRNSDRRREARGAAWWLQASLVGQSGSSLSSGGCRKYWKVSTKGRLDPT